MIIIEIAKSRGETIERGGKRSTWGRFSEM